MLSPRPQPQPDLTSLATDDPKRIKVAISSPAGLALATNRLYLAPPHVKVLNRRIYDIGERIVRRTDIREGKGHGPRLMVFMPPRHGKSLTASQYFSAFFLGHHPDKRVVVASYEQGLAIGWARRSRDILVEFGMPFFGMRVRGDTKRASLWETDAGGGMQAVGVGSGLTGRGADLLIIDDPVKDAVQAASEVTRENVWNWWQTTARTRLMPGGGVLVIMTRWHEDDLAGRLLRDDPTRDGKTGALLPPGERRDDAEGDEWEVLCLPGLAEDDHPLMDGPDPLGRKVGEALWPEQFDERFMERTAKATGAFWFGAMYQQRPAPAEGGLFKRANFRYWTGDYQGGGKGVLILARDDGPFPLDLSYCLVFQTCDVAATEEEESDYTVVSTWALTPQKDLVLLDVAREKLESPKQPAWVTAQFALHRPAYIGIEAKTFGLSLLQYMSRQGIPVRRLEADRDKVARATTAAVRYETHSVFHPLSHPLKDDMERELLTFPNATHDDIVDTVAYAALEAMGTYSPGITRTKADPARSAPMTGGLSRDDR